MANAWLQAAARLCVLCAAGSGSFAVKAWSQEEWLQQIDVSDLKRHCTVLAADALEGREAGSRGGQAAAAYLVSEFRRLGLEPAGDGKDFRQSFGQNYSNVLARLPGSDDALRDECVVIGAHYDHVGYGNSSNSHGPLGQIHNGADDNASGVSVLLELAQALRVVPAPMRRTVVIAAWDAEEIGLLGSQHWVNQLGPRRKSVKLGVNIDMIGRMQTDRVMVVGWRSAAGLRSRLVEQNGPANIAFQFEPQVQNDSDHYSLYAGQIPVLHFDTGKHPDYHRPSDDVDKLKWDDMVRLAQVVARLVRAAADDPTLPAFRPDCFREPTATHWDPRARKPAPVRLGVSWSSEELKQGRIKVVSIAPQSPAQRIGLQPGDEFLEFDCWKQGTYDELRTVITCAPPSTRLVWRRPNVPEPMSATCRLTGEQVRCGIGLLPDPAMPGTFTVTHVVETSPADRAGLQPGDVLLQWGHEPVPAPEELARRVQNDSGPIRVVFEREGRVNAKTLELPPRP